MTKIDQQIDQQIEQWRNRPLETNTPYVFLDSIWPKRCRGGEVQNVSVLMVMTVNQDGTGEEISPRRVVWLKILIINFGNMPNWQKLFQKYDSLAICPENIVTS